MKLNSFKYILPAAAMLLTAGVTSCVKDLDVTPIDPSSTMVVDEPALYTKCYANMALAGQGGANGDCDIDGLDGGTTGFVRQMWNAGELPTDEAICAWGDEGIASFNFNQYDASHPMLRGFYYRLYAGVTYCNHYLDICNGVDATRTAEVRFLRALYYYFLMDCYGNVPFTTELSSTSPKQIKRAELFNWIESELKAVQPSLLESSVRKEGETGYGRADKDAVNMLLARMYLNAEVYTGTARWQEALDYAEAVINGPHKLWTTSVNGWRPYQMLFMGDNGISGASQEAILPLLQDGLTTTSWGTSLFLMASAWKSDMNMSYYTVNGNPVWLPTGSVDNDPDDLVDTVLVKSYAYGTSEYWAGNRARSQLIGKFFQESDDTSDKSIEEMADLAGDDRALFFSKGRELKVTTPTEYTSGYAVGKFRNTYATDGAPHNSQFIDTDYFLMRSAEAYLIAAEADARLNNGTTTAKGTGYLNLLRERSIKNKSKADRMNYTLDQILDERSRELYFEGFRRTDLVRFGLFNSASYLWDWKAGAENGAGFDKHLNLFAIPDEDMNANPNLVQNPGY